MNPPMQLPDGRPFKISDWLARRMQVLQVTPEFVRDVWIIHDSKFKGNYKHEPVPMAFIIWMSRHHEQPLPSYYDHQSCAARTDGEYVLICAVTDDFVEGIWLYKKKSLCGEEHQQCPLHADDLAERERWRHLYGGH